MPNLICAAVPFVEDENLSFVLSFIGKTTAATPFRIFWQDKAVVKHSGGRLASPFFVETFIGLTVNHVESD